MNIENNYEIAIKYLKEHARTRTIIKHGFENYLSKVYLGEVPKDSSQGKQLEMAWFAGAMVVLSALVSPMYDEEKIDDDLIGEIMDAVQDELHKYHKDSINASILRMTPAEGSA